MDDLELFLTGSINFKRNPISRGSVDGRIKQEPSTSRVKVERQILGTEYAKECKLKEEKRILEAWNSNRNASAMDVLDDGDDNVSVSSRISLHSKYNIKVPPTNLPIMHSKNHILASIEDNPVIIIQGSTGCGKTTQVPQFILEHCHNKQEYCNIVVTQPRRIAAISIAKRVCNEHGLNVGDLIGHQVGLNAVVSEDTRLLYCTTGVLLQKLIREKKLCRYTHIILDEVHERDAEMDFLLIVIRMLLSPNVKIILMSATIQAQSFSEYFRFGRHNTLKNAPIINVDRKTEFSVNEYYLCMLDGLKVDTSKLIFDEPGISDEVYSIACKLVRVCDNIDSQENVDSTTLVPSILMFLPGIHEIEHMYNILNNFKNQYNLKLLIIPLHSTITIEEQNRAFHPAPYLFRKVILATNIAESSITVPDIKYVIDFCLTKVLITDSSTGFTSLQLQWAAKSNCKQRSGRAGRVMNGRVYRLIPKNFYEKYLANYSTPELLRSPLENVILKAKLLDMGPPQAILGLAMDPPDLSCIIDSIFMLKETGGLLKTTNGIYNIHDGDITFIGRLMADLPLDIRVSRLIVLGFIFSVLDEAIIIAAGLSVRNIFSIPFKRGDYSQWNAYSSKLNWSDGSNSDLIAMLNVYELWVKHSKQNKNADSEAWLRDWAKRYSIQPKSLKEMAEIVNDINRRLKNKGIHEMYGINRLNWSRTEKAHIIKIIICGAFYPNFFLKSSVDEQRIYRDLAGRDPCNTVYFNGFDPKYLRMLYDKPIKEIVKKCTYTTDNIKVTYDNTSFKCFVTFLNSKPSNSLITNKLQPIMPGRIVPEIYKAVKLRKVNADINKERSDYSTHQIEVMDVSVEKEYAQSKGLGSEINGIWTLQKKCIKKLEYIVLPQTHISSVYGFVTHFEHCNKFWFCPDTCERQKEIIEEMIEQNLHKLIPFDQPKDDHGQILLAPFRTVQNSPEKKYFRVKIKSFNRKKEDDNDNIFDVILIDYGDVREICLSELRQFKDNNQRLEELPPLVFECTLAEIQPSIIHSPFGIWIKDANDLFERFIKNKKMEAEVYSVVNGVVSVYLKYRNESINSLLIEKGYAQYCEENYMSMNNHVLRVRKRNSMRNPNTKLDKFEYDENVLGHLQENFSEDIEPPEKKFCKRTVKLSGPYSPLETSLYSLKSMTSFKIVSIDQTSVNNVLLNSDPQNPHEQLLVAASVAENEGNLTARSTTLMPHIKGFAALMALIFCPSMEIRRDETKCHYTNLLVGLGYDPVTNEPLMPQHDLLFNLDVEITPNDIKKINEIRYSMDSLLLTLPGEECPNLNENEKVQLTYKIKNSIIELLEQDRESIGVEYCGNFTWNTNNNDTNYDEELNVDNIHGSRAIFPQHTGILELKIPNSDEVKRLRQHCRELHNLKELDISIKPMECKLCKKTIESIPELRIHLFSNFHNKREKKIKFEL